MCIKHGRKQKKFSLPPVFRILLSSWKSPNRTDKQNHSCVSTFSKFAQNAHPPVQSFSWLDVLGLTALWDSISVYIGPSPKEREKDFGWLVVLGLTAL